MTFVTDGYYFANAPQGDATRSYNYVRLVRDADLPNPADLNGDGVTDQNDLEIFVNCISGPNESYSPAECEAADFDDDDDVDLEDYQEFQANLVISK